MLDALQERSNTLFDVPTALGKTHTIATASWGEYPSLTNRRPVVHFHKTRDARDEAAKKSKNAGLDSEVLQGWEEISLPASDAFDWPSIRGKPLRQWIHQQCERNGMRYPEAVHRAKIELNDDLLDEAPLTGIQWADLLPLTRADVDIIHATHQFAFAPPLRNGTVAVFDEQPDFTRNLKDSPDELSRERIRCAVVAYLDEGEAPIQTLGLLMELSKGGADKPFQGELQNALTHQTDRDWCVSNDDAHPLAPALTRAIFRAEPRSTGRYVGTATYTPQAPSGFGGSNLNTDQEVTVVFDDENTIQTVRVVPDMSQAHTILGLDAFPTKPLWELNTGVSFDVNHLLSAPERMVWRRREKQLRVVQVGSNANHCTHGIENTEKVRALVEEIRDRHGSDFSTAITSKAAEDTLKQMMEVAGVNEPTILTFGEQNSRNVLGDEDVGLVVGCIDMGDGPVLDRLAELGLEASPDRKNTECSDCEGDGCRECNHTGKERAEGRGFAGPDARIAERICASVRQDEVKQATSRWGRNPDDPTDSATVYVHTNVIRPSLLLDDDGEGVEILAKKQSNVVSFARDRGATTAREVSDNINVSRKHASNVLKRLVERGYASVDRGAGSYNRDVFTVASATPTDRFVDLG
ncbi:helix-turn-helix domain-containing protein [Haloarchaeobius sp. FL176]|uniref:helix-turn-helix domain-containing protein n=1 Tax=Haloarchaeobius sp. FL176 TaxID=2967129 RepID=UPI002147FF9F|nr:helix-turn-helix domain-containing protein [Haloarchaeobius sp. FL176]